MIKILIVVELLVVDQIPMAPTRERIIKTPPGPAPMSHLCISGVLIFLTTTKLQLDYLQLKKKNTNIQPSTLSNLSIPYIKLSTSWVQGNSNHQQGPASYNQLGRPICNSTYDGSPENAMYPPTRQVGAFLPCRICAAYWVDLHWIAGCDQNLAPKNGVVDLPEVLLDSYKRCRNKWCFFNQFLLNSTVQIFLFF